MNLAAKADADIERFMSNCLVRYSATQCVCMLERRERALSAGQSAGAIRDVLATSSAGAAYEFTEQCKQSTAPSNQQKSPLATGEFDSRVASNGLSDPRTASVSPSSPHSMSKQDKPVERLITDTEVCIQNEILVRAAKSRDGSISMSEFDEVRMKCGG